MLFAQLTSVPFAYHSIVSFFLPRFTTRFVQGAWYEVVSVFRHRRNEAHLAKHSKTSYTASTVELAECPT